MTLTHSFIPFLAQTEEAESWLDAIQSGGIVGAILIGLSMVAVMLVIVHVVQIRRKALIPPQHVDEIESNLERGDVDAALSYCLEPKHDSYLTRILAAGLTRYQKSAFGAFEIKNALEEAGEDQTARLYRSTDALGVIGGIAPLLGLLGTVIGMMGAFRTLPQAGPTGSQALAENISLALITTLMGLILAIPTVALFTFFRNRIDAIASEASREIERLVLHLESSHGIGPVQPTAAAAGPRSAAPPTPRPQPAARTDA